MRVGCAAHLVASAWGVRIMIGVTVGRGHAADEATHKYGRDGMVHRRRGEQTQQRSTDDFFRPQILAGQGHFLAITNGLEGSTMELEKTRDNLFRPDAFLEGIGLINSSVKFTL